MTAGSRRDGRLPATPILLEVTNPALHQMQQPAVIDRLLLQILGRVVQWPMFDR